MRSALASSLRDDGPTAEFRTFLGTRTIVKGKTQQWSRDLPGHSLERGLSHGLRERACEVSQLFPALHNSSLGVCV